MEKIISIVKLDKDECLYLKTTNQQVANKYSDIFPIASVSERITLKTNKKTFYITTTKLMDTEDEQYLTERKSRHDQYVKLSMRVDRWDESFDGILGDLKKDIQGDLILLSGFCDTFKEFADDLITLNSVISNEIRNEIEHL